MIWGIWSQYLKIPLMSQLLQGCNNWTLRWPLHLSWTLLDLTCGVEDLYLPPKFSYPWFGIFGSIIPQSALITLKLARLKPHMIFELERDQFGCKIGIWRFWSTFCLFMPMILGLVTISLNCPNALNTIKEVQLLPEMTSGTLGPWLFQIVKIGMSTFLFAFTRSQICWAPMKIWRFQNIESHAILLHFVLNKKLMQIETNLFTKSIMSIISCAG